MSEMKVWIKETDTISVKSMLELLNVSIEGMKEQLATNPELTDKARTAAEGAIMAITDLHNLILSQVNELRTAEKFDDGGDDHGGKFDA